jgi:outer membrane immunogenic protein
MLRLPIHLPMRAAAAFTALAAAVLVAPQAALAQGQGPSNWSGLYAGVHGGVGAGSVQGGSASGGLIGGQVGFNAQADRIVLGVEGDVTSSGFEHRGFNGGGQTFKQKWVGTVRGRVGYAADQVLIYGTAGGAGASNQLRDVSGKAEQRTVGWVVGAGAEARLTDRIGLRAEVLHYALGTATFTTPAAIYRADNRVNVLRAGVNYRF